MNHQGETLRSAPAVPQQWLLAEAALPELEARAKVEMLRVLGQTSIRGMGIEAPVSPDANHKDSLQAAAQMGALGDERSKNVVRTNVSTDMVERVFKIGQTRVEMEFRGDELYQDDRPLVEIQRNALIHTELSSEMLKRTKHELKVPLLIAELRKAGILNTHDVVFFSTTSTTMSQKEKQRYNFFTDTESMSIQYFLTRGDQVTLETAFVAGKPHAMAGRKDIVTLQKMAKAKGIDLQTADGTDMLQHIFLIPKGEAKGVEDVVRWYDDVEGTFYGQNKPRQDYRQFAAECYQRSANFGDMVEQVTEQLLREAHTFKTPMDAILRLDELSAEACRHRALTDSSIDVSIFGKEAASHLTDARFFLARGDQRRAAMAMHRAAETDMSGSCPLVRKRREFGDEDPDDLFDEAGTAKSGEGEALEWRPGYCRVKNCPGGREITQVAQCDVCRQCQAIFDSGKEPNYPTLLPATATRVPGYIEGILRSVESMFPGERAKHEQAQQKAPHIGAAVLVSAGSKVLAGAGVN